MIDHQKGGGWGLPGATICRERIEKMTIPGL